MTERQNRNLGLRLKKARLRLNAAVEDIDYRPPAARGEQLRDGATDAGTATGDEDRLFGRHLYLSSISHTVYSTNGPRNRTELGTWAYRMV
jgi:hypothetical protein